MKNIIIIALVFTFLFFMYRSCTKGYDSYGYFVQVKDEIVFNKPLSESDPRIVAHGRKLLSDIILLDQQVDQADGQDEGLLRWYACSGIDCDERWQVSFPASRDNKQSGKKKMHPDELEKARIKAYGQYDPSTVNMDVAQDIANQSVKLFYADFYEAPEVLILNESAQDLPNHKMISIGTGCTDLYDSENCPKAYRAAVDKALEYGRAYNKAMASHFNLKTKEDDPERLETSHGLMGLNASKWHRFKIGLYDIQPLFGGRNIWIEGDSGHVFVQAVRSDKQDLEQKNYSFFLEKDEIDKIVKAFVEHDFLSLKDTAQIGVPDQAKPKITLEDAIGNIHSVWNWSPPVKGGDQIADKRFQAIYRAILRMETKAIETLEPVTTGPYAS